MLAKRAPAAAAVAMTLILVAACGGGGGGSDPAPAVQREQPLSLTTINSLDAASAALGYGESILMVGQASVDWLDEIASAGQTVLQGACSNTGGSRIITLRDNNGDRRPGAGDRLEVALSNCQVDALAEVVTGSLTIDLSVAPTSSTRWSGVVTFGGQFLIATDALGSVRLGGALRFEAVEERLAKTLRVLSTNPEFTVTYTVGSVTAQDMVTGLEVVKEVRRDTARATASLRFRLASDVLKGAINVTTPARLAAWFDTYPDAGTVLVTGAGAAALRVVAQSAESQFLDVRLDGAPAATLLAAEATDGYLWSSTGIIPPDPAVEPYVTQVGSGRPFQALVKPDPSATLSPSASVAWQFSRPISSPTAVTAQFRSETPSQWGVPVIEATVAAEGALLTVTPATQLEPGVTYGLYFADQPFGISIAAADGTGRTDLQNQFTVAQTIDVSARTSGSAQLFGDVLLYGQAGTATIEAQAAAGAGASLSSVRWRQVSGPSLTIAQPDSPTTSVSIAPQALGQAPGVAVLEVEARTTAGDTDRTRVQLQVVADASMATIFGSRDNSDGAFRVAVVLDPPAGNTGSGPVSLVGARLLDILIDGRVFIKPPPTVAWAPGMTYNFTRNASDTDTAALRLYSDASGFRTCDGISGTVSVGDFALDASSQLVQISMEYRFQCASGERVQGWLRMHTSVPPPP